jgi:uncharacterized membrane protein HdeD (DUF308 family)
MRPLEGILTLMLIALFLFEGVIFAVLDWRHHASNWGWLLLNGMLIWSSPH